MFDWKGGLESLRSQSTRVARLVSGNRISWMDGYVQGGSKLTREVLVIRVVGRLPWLHLLHLVSDVGQCRRSDEQTALSTSDAFLSNELQASPHRVTRTLKLVAKETESSHEAHFACFDIYIQLSPHYLNLLASNLYIPGFPQ
jgi:hypothetical protein